MTTTYFETEEFVQSDRRARNSRRQPGSESSEDCGSVPPRGQKMPRRKAYRRRQIDPTTCERDYSRDEIEFMQALDIYKRQSGRMFPTCSEILEVIHSLGYVRIADDATTASAEISSCPNSGTQ
jgi:hypothetical protein